MIPRIRMLINENFGVISNYFHMTFLHILNSFFYLLAYPYVIKMVGIEEYGMYVFLNSLIAYFSTLINFGFDIPAAGKISEDPANKKAHTELISVILTARIILLTISSVAFLFMIKGSDFFLKNSSLFSSCFLSVFSSVLLPAWYFHGMQKMKILTHIQLFFKLISLFFIFSFVDETGISIYALIVSLTNLVISAASLITVYYYFNVNFKISPVSNALKLIKETRHFFLSSSINIFKQKSLELIIGSCFGMKEVAIYNLADKIFSIPSLLMSSANAALYPRIINNIRPDLIRKIILSEFVIGILAILAVAVSGKVVIEFLPIKNITDSYSLAVLLSFNIMTYLIVGAIIYFIFVPHKKYKFIYSNQIVSAISFLFFCALNMSISFSVYSVVFALVLSGFSEILYCLYLVKRLKLNNLFD